MPISVPSPGNNRETLVLARRFPYLYQAELAQAVLRHYGIESILFDTNMLAATSYSQALGGVRLMIPAEYLEKSLAILDDIDNSAPTAVDEYGDITQLDSNEADEQDDDII
jgi:hypothetical protein